ncbi:MAG: hypothetical protein HY225_01870 [Candidatus Vogelbacteria bacterium]|nr:hypothetical protein [Candidatus Vogelbacteria bacterium]
MAGEKIGSFVGDSPEKRKKLEEEYDAYAGTRQAFIDMKHLFEDRVDLFLRNADKLTGGLSSGDIKRNRAIAARQFAKEIKQAAEKANEAAQTWLDKTREK